MMSTGFGPPPRDELASWSAARLDDGPLAPIPAYTASPPPGRTVTVGGQDIFLRVTAGPELGRRVWYVHGLEGSSRNWDRLTGALSGRAIGYAPDLPGSGRSAPFADGRYSIVREAALIAELIRRETGGGVDLVGNSRGGVIATYLAARYPELVTSLTLVSPAVPDLRLVRDRGADPRLAMVLLPGITRTAVKRLAALTPAQRARQIALSCFGEPELLTDADLAAAEAEMAAQDRGPWAAVATVASLKSLMRCYLRPGRWSFSAAAAAVIAPTLVVWGTRDRLVDARLALPTTARFRDGRLLMIPRAGHVAQMERPAEVARAMVALWADMGAPDPAPLHSVAT